MADELDPVLYLRGPVIDVPSGFSLGVAMLSALPREAPAGSPARNAARNVRSAVVTLQEAWRASEKFGPPDRRSFDAVADASWRALCWRLEAATLLSGTPELLEIAKEAKELYARVFTSGLAFTQLPYASQWAHAERLLQDIDEDGLARRIDAICGEPYLAFVRRAHAAYGEALRITARASDQEVGGGVREPLRRLQVAIQEYVFALFTQFPPSKPASHPILRRALKPIDDHRAQQARGGGAPAEPVEPGRPAAPTPAPEPAGPAPTDPIPDVS